MTGIMYAQFGSSRSCSKYMSTFVHRCLVYGHEPSTKSVSRKSKLYLQCTRNITKVCSLPGLNNPGQLSYLESRCRIHSPVTKQNMSEIKSARKDALEIFYAGVDSVYPPQMIKNAVTVAADGNSVIVDGKSYELDNNVYVVGFGKAVSGMARALETLLGQHLVEGVISIPHGSCELFTSLGKQELCLEKGSKIRTYEGAITNLPDEAAHTAAMEIMKLVEKLTDKHLLFVLISGGGSSLLPSPIPPVTLDDQIELTRLLSRSGASIHQLNTLRQNVELLKGGGLARIAHPAAVVSLILSDVVGDKLDIISSGPTSQLRSSPRQCLQILDILQIKEQVPPTVLETLNIKANKKKLDQLASPYEQKAVSEDSSYEHVHNVIIGSNTIATKAAFEKARELNYIPIVLTNSLQGDASKVADFFNDLAKFVIYDYGDMPPYQGKDLLVNAELELVQHGVTKTDMKRLTQSITQAYNTQKDICIICGGETTVNVTGSGCGGRNQEMALAFALLHHKFVSEEVQSAKLLSNFHAEFLSAGTDGQDGPTDATGAVVNTNLVPMALVNKLDPHQYLDNNDSYTLFKQLSDSNSLIESGLTGTNVMDIQLLMIKFLKS